MSEGVLGACCRCGFIVKQAAITTSWNAWGGFAVFDGTDSAGVPIRVNPDADNPKYASVTERFDYRGSFSATFDRFWKWFGPIGNAGWWNTLDDSIVNDVQANWGRGQGVACGCVTPNGPQTERHYGYHYDGGKSDNAHGCLPDNLCDGQWQLTYGIDLDDVVDWRKPSITFDTERAILDAIDWTTIPNECLGPINLLDIFSNGEFPPEIPNGDLVKFLFGSSVPIQFGPASVVPGLFTVDGDVASARVLCGPDPDGVYDFFYGPNHDGPLGLDPFLNPPASGVARTGNEAPSLYRGFVVRTRIENADTFCSVEFDQIGTQCGGDGIGANYAIGPCKKGVTGPILYEPLSLGLILASFDNKYPCCR